MLLPAQPCYRRLKKPQKPLGLDFVSYGRKGYVGRGLYSADVTDKPLEPRRLLLRPATSPSFVLSDAMVAIDARFPDFIAVSTPWGGWLDLRVRRCAVSCFFGLLSALAVLSRGRGRGRGIAERAEDLEELLLASDCLFRTPLPSVDGGLLRRTASSSIVLTASMREELDSDRNES